MVRAYVESLLEALTGAGQAMPDNDGDYPVRYRNALYYVRIHGETHPVVQVFSVAVAGVDATPELMTALNDLNSRISFTRAFWVRGQVLVEADLLGEAVEPMGFDNACRRVATITDDVAAGLAAQFGGTTAFEDGKSEGYDQEQLPGFYL